MAKTNFQPNELTKKWIQSFKHLKSTQGLSQLKLQKDIGLNQSFISQILTNRVNFPPKYLEKYCKTYNININSIKGSGGFNITGGNSRSKGEYSVDKVIESLKHALSNNGSDNANIHFANRLLINVENKLTSLQEDISTIQRALGGASPKRGHKTRR